MAGLRDWWGDDEPTETVREAKVEQDKKKSVVKGDDFQLMLQPPTTITANSIAWPTISGTGQHMLYYATTSAPVYYQDEARVQPASYKIKST